MKLFNYYLLNVFAQGLGRIFTFGSNFIAFAIIARVFSSDLFGQYSYFLNYFVIFIILADFGLMSVLGKDIAQQKDLPELYWGNFLFLRVIINIIVIFISIIFAYFVRRDLFSLLFIGSLSIPFLASRFFEPVFQVYQRPWYSTYASILYGITHLFFVFIAIKFQNKLLNFILAYIFANILYAIFALYLSLKSLKPSFKIEKLIIKKILKLAAPLGISSIFITISSRISVLLLAWMKSDYSVGFYSAAYKFVEISSFLAAMITTPLIPIFVEKAKISIGSIKDLSSKIFEFMAIILIPIGILCSSLGEGIISLIYGPKLLPSVGIFKILIWECIIIFYSLLTASIAIALGIVRFAYWLGAASAVLSAILNYLLIPKFDYSGSAWSALICEFFLVSITLNYVIKYTGNFFKWKTWVKILTLNIFLYIFLSQNIFLLKNYIKYFFAIFLYLLFILKFNIINRDLISLLKNKIYSFLARIKINS